jgi:hypothetical protein
MTKSFIQRSYFSPYQKEGYTDCSNCPLLPYDKDKVLVRCCGGFHVRLISGRRRDKSYYPRFWGSEKCKLVGVTIGVEKEL